MKSFLLLLRKEEFADDVDVGAPSPTPRFADEAVLFLLLLLLLLLDFVVGDGGGVGTPDGDITMRLGWDVISREDDEEEDDDERVGLGI